MKKQKWLCALLLVVLFGAISSFTAYGEQPHIQRSGPNLLTNPDFNGLGGWPEGNRSGTYDSTVTRDSGTGSFKMTIPYPETNYSYIVSGLIAVTPGKTYTLSHYMLSDIFPSPSQTMFVGYFDASQNMVRNSYGSRQSVTTSGSWQECVLLLRPQPGEVYAQIKTVLAFQPPVYSGSIWVDNYYFGEGIGFEQAPTAKVPFDGSQIKVDSLGNIEINKNSNWIPFFPICVYADVNRPDWTVYSSQGFNAVMETGSYDYIQKAKNATSAFNPDGMMAGLEFNRFIYSGHPYYNNLSLLTNTINDIKNNNLMSNLLWYYWDNEYYGEWQVAADVTNKIKELDVDANGSRMHPIYALQGNEGLARKYKNSDENMTNINTGEVNMTDIVGSYVSMGNPAIYPDDRGAFQLITLNNVERQKNPVVIAQINLGVGMLFRPRVFTAIAKGAKGIGFWRDYYQGSDDITMQPWWDDLPNIRREIDQLLPIIQMPHWTNWSLNSNNSLIDFGTRDYQGKGYIIVANEQASAQTVTFTISNLTYTPSMVRNFFTNNFETEISNAQFTVTIPAYGSRVYVLERNIEAMLSLKLLYNENGGSTAYDASMYANNGTLTGNAALGSGVLTLGGTWHFVDCGNGASLEMGNLDLSIVARVKISTSQSGLYAGIVTKGAATQANMGYSFVYRVDIQKLVLVISDGSTRSFLMAPTTFNLQDNIWHTVGVSLDRDGNAVFYVDGASMGAVNAELASSDITNSAQHLLVGNWEWGHYLNGQMDDVRVYKKALTSQEMADIARNSVLNVQFNEASGATAYDSSINSNNGTLVGNAVLGGGYMALDNSGDYADFSNSSTLDMGTNNMTIVSRIKLDPTQNAYTGIVTKGAGCPSNAGYALFIYGGRLVFALSNGTSRLWLSSDLVTLNDGIWHTVGVSVTRNGNAVFYVDGSSVGSASASSLFGYDIVNTNQNLLVGSWLGYAPYSLHGSMDYAMIFMRALSPSEMETATR